MLTCSILDSEDDDDLSDREQGEDVDSDGEPELPEREERTRGPTSAVPSAGML